MQLIEEMSSQTKSVSLVLKPRRFYVFLPYMFLALLGSYTPFVHVPKVPYLLEIIALFVVLEIIFCTTVGRAFIAVHDNTITSRYVKTKTMYVSDISSIMAAQNGLLLQGKQGGRLILHLSIYNKRDITSLLNVLQPYLPAAGDRSWRLRLLLKSYTVRT